MRDKPELDSRPLKVLKYFQPKSRPEGLFVNFLGDLPVSYCCYKIICVKSFVMGRYEDISEGIRRGDGELIKVGFPDYINQ